MKNLDLLFDKKERMTGQKVVCRNGGEEYGKTFILAAKKETGEKKILR